MIPLFKVLIAPGVAEAAKKVLESGYIGQGPEVEQFETELTSWVGLRPLTVNSGTSALHLALHLVGVGIGDEVVSTPMTCFATNAPIFARGAKIVWADIDPSTGNIDSDDVIRKISKKTKAVVCVDLGGYPCELDTLMAICNEHGISLIEDAAHAFGATFKERPIGSIAHFTAFSFQAIKHLTTIDGGILTSTSGEALSRGKLLRWYGIDREGSRKDLRCEEDIREAGYKFHMNDVAAAIGRAQLFKTPWVLSRHRGNAELYVKALSGLRRVRLLSYNRDRLSSYWLFTILVDDRNSFQSYMENHGIMTSQVHVRNDLHSVSCAFRADLPGADAFSSHQVSIPVGWWLDRDDCEKIIESILAWDES